MSNSETRWIQLQAAQPGIRYHQADGPLTETHGYCSSQVPHSLELWGPIVSLSFVDSLILGSIALHPHNMEPCRWMWLDCSELVSSCLHICLIHNVQGCYASKHHLGLGLFSLGFVFSFEFVWCLQFLPWPGKKPTVLHVCRNNSVRHFPMLQN